ncbi:hypothetical protein L6452_08069 [Arctium lappa]|uniref:Uncharacterized protein n=1 Tax=Arctium lappa TaxID=4217 RepID=A0ACB9DGQ0_ARCLA|nr:hypothetical protein L6452_08069 [Arctium lappa]
MEMKSMCNPAKQIKILEEVGMDLDGLVVDCLNKGDENRSIEDYTDFMYNRSQDSTSWANEDLERLNVSPEYLSTIYLKYLDEYSNVKTSIERIDIKKRERTSKSDFCMDTTDFWCGDSELSKKLFLDKILEKDVGLNAMPPSFVNGCLKNQRRKEKIEAAKKRIEKIRRPSVAANESGDLCVKEEEIEKGHYNTLLDLHVFNSGDCLSSFEQLIERLLEVGTATVTKEEAALARYMKKQRNSAIKLVSKLLLLMEGFSLVFVKTEGGADSLQHWLCQINFPSPQ